VRGGRETLGSEPPKVNRAAFYAVREFKRREGQPLARGLLGALAGSGIETH
jgi:hypothetical protein